jgi:F0F1-type ATP synthase gamma subunit
VALQIQVLRLDVSSARQEEVTTELLDLITGEEAVR